MSHLAQSAMTPDDPDPFPAAKALSATALTPTGSATCFRPCQRQRAGGLEPCHPNPLGYKLVPARRRLIFRGHNHVPGWSVATGRAWCANSLPQRLSDPLIRRAAGWRWARRGSRATVARRAGRWYTGANELTFRRTPYDFGTTAAKTRAAGPPETGAAADHWAIG